MSLIALEYLRKRKQVNVLIWDHKHLNQLDQIPFEKRFRAEKLRGMGFDDIAARVSDRKIGGSLSDNLLI